MNNTFNTLRPRQNGPHFIDDIFKCIFLYENVWITIWISLKFVPKGPINNIPALVQIMAWRRPGDKPLSEPMMVRLPTHICVTRPQWVKLTTTIARAQRVKELNWLFLLMGQCKKDKTPSLTHYSSIANAQELRLSCTIPLRWCFFWSLEGLWWCVYPYWMSLISTVNT